MKRWQKRNEWVQYAACKDSVDHTLPIERGEEDRHLPAANQEQVQAICDSCPVRPECIQWALGSDRPVDVWVAGRYIPVGEGRRLPKRVTELWRLRIDVRLASTLSAEFLRRGDF